MKVKHPFTEPPFACEHQATEPVRLRSALRLTHYVLDNGYTVSILHPLAEAWCELIVWPTAKGLGPDSRHQIGVTRYYEDNVSALLDRNKIAAWPPPGFIRVDGVVTPEPR